MQAWVRVLYAVVLLPIVAAITAALMVGYLLWGTSRSYERSQDLLHEAFEAGETEQPVARMTSTAMDLDAYVMAGVSADTLTDGPGKYPGTTAPGQLGNIAIAGRRATYGGPFAKLDQLVIGDEIQLETVDRAYTYRVSDTRRNRESDNLIVGPATTDLLSDNGGAQLTLVALHPRFSTQQRLVVFAELVGQPTGPRPDGLDREVVLGLGSDPYDWRAMQPGAGLALAAWFGMWFMGRPRRATAAFHVGASVLMVAGLCWAVSIAAPALPPF